MSNDTIENQIINDLKKRSSDTPHIDPNEDTQGLIQELSKRYDAPEPVVEQAIAKWDAGREKADP